MPEWGILGGKGEKGGPGQRGPRQEGPRHGGGSDLFGPNRF